MSGEALRAEGVRKVYKSRRGPEVVALQGISLAIARGERVALLGRNGAGKTTFLRIASTLLIPTAGHVEVFGHDVDRNPDRVRPYIAVVPQEGKPFFHLTPREQVRSYLEARGMPTRLAKERADEALGQMDLLSVADRLNITLSGGQRQRTMVATVISTEAPLLFLDEPTIGMDPFARRAVWETMRRLTRKGSTILLTTHYLDEADALSERLYIVERGRVLVEGTAEGLKRQVGGSLKVTIPGGEAMREAFQSFGPVSVEDGQLNVLTGPTQLAELIAIALREKLTAQVGPVTLEEAFLRVVGRGIDDES